MELFEKQYEWIKRTREVLFRYCETLPAEDYVKEVEAFGGDSIRSLHVHVANCYRIWLGNRALGKALPQITHESVHSVQEMRELFKKTDELVEEFLAVYKGKWDNNVQVTYRSGGTAGFTALWLFTHTATHEFHHKGQIVKIGRYLGHIPPDTDLIEF